MMWTEIDQLTEEFALIDTLFAEFLHLLPIHINFETAQHFRTESYKVSYTIV